MGPTQILAKMVNDEANRTFGSISSESQNHSLDSSDIYIPVFAMNPQRVHRIISLRFMNS